MGKKPSLRELAGAALAEEAPAQPSRLKQLAQEAMSAGGQFVPPSVSNPPSPGPATEADLLYEAPVPTQPETLRIAMPKDIPVMSPAQIEQQQHDSDMGGLQSETPVFSAPPTNEPGVDPKWERVMEDYRSARGNKDLGIPEKDMTPGYAGTALRERALNHQMRLLGQRKERYERALQGEATRGRGVQQPRIEAIDQEVAPILAKLEQGAPLSGEETTQYLTLKAEREQLAGAYNAEMAPFITEGKELQAAHQYLTTKLQETAVAAAKDPKQIELAKIQRISDERFRMAQERVKKAEGPLATTLMMHDPLVLSEYLAKPVYDEVLRFGGNVGATTLRASARLGKATTPGDQNIGTIGLDDAANWFSDGLRRLEADKPKKLKAGLFADDWSINEGVLPKFMQGATYMSLLAVGGEAGGVAGMTGMSMVGSSDDYYREGKDAGMSDGEAEGFAFLMSGIEAGVENINRGPFVSGAARSELAKRALKNIRAGKPMKSAWLEIPKYLVEQGIQEGPVEEVLTALGQNALKSGANGLVDSNLDTDLTIQSLASDAAMGAALGGLMASGKTISYRPLYKESVRWAVDNQEEFQAWAQENVKEEELPNVLAKLEQYAKIYRGIPPEVPADKAANIAAAVAEKEAIKEQQKDQVLDPVVAEVMGDPLSDRIEELDETIKQNLEPSEPKDGKETDTDRSGEPSAEADVPGTGVPVAVRGLEGAPPTERPSGDIGVDAGEVVASEEVAPPDQGTSAGVGTSPKAEQEEGEGAGAVPDDRITPRPGVIEEIGEDRARPSYRAVVGQVMGHLKSEETFRQAAEQAKTAKKKEALIKNAEHQERLAYASIDEFRNIATEEDVARLLKDVGIEEVGVDEEIMTGSSKWMQPWHNPVRWRGLETSGERERYVALSKENDPNGSFNPDNFTPEEQKEIGLEPPVSTTVNTPEAKPTLAEATGSIDDERFLAENGVPLNKGPLTTKSGRVIDPPKLKGRQSQRLQQIDNWLVEQAIEEFKDADPLGSPKQRDNDYKQGIAKGMLGKDGKAKLSPSDRTVLNELLWPEKPAGTKTAEVSPTPSEDGTLREDAPAVDVRQRTEPGAATEEPGQAAGAPVKREPASTEPDNEGEGASEPDGGGGERAGDRDDTGAGGRTSVDDGDATGTDTGERAKGDTGRAPIAEADRNHVLPRDRDWIKTGDKAKAKANIDALKLLQTLEKEDRNPTPLEKATLAEYVGWGGLAQVFDEGKAYYRDNPPRTEQQTQEHNNWEKNWGKLYDEVKKLLTEKEWKSAASSTINAHYSAREVIVEIWNAARKLGFKGGRVLEPGAGIGHFAGLVPEEIRDMVKFSMVELDNVSARILAKLYPEASVQNIGFQDARLSLNSFDMTISNFPFAKQGPSDKSMPHQFSLHDYFFAKALNYTKPGGLIAAITSSGTMDSPSSRKFREYMDERATLVGAIRLPNNAFSKNAGTEVTTDILFFRKNDETSPLRREFVNTVAMDPDAEVPIIINTYFDKRPEMMLGKMTLEGTMYRGNEQALVAHKGMDLQAELKRAIEEGLPTNVMGSARASASKESGPVDFNAKVGQLMEREGKVVQAQADGTLDVPDWAKSADKVKQAKAYIGLRDHTRAHIGMMLDENSTNADVAASMATLNKLYDAYNKKYDRVGKAKSQFLDDDVDFPLVLALEDENTVLVETKTKGGKFVDRRVKEFEKAKIFRERTIHPRKAPAKVDSVDDALQVSKNYRGKVDIEYMAELTDKTEEQVKKELTDSGEAFENPTSGLWESKSKYLSGFVKLKLKEAMAAAEQDDAYQVNVEALKKVQPERIAIENVGIRLGSQWVPTPVVEQFIKDLLEIKARVHYSPLTGAWTVKQQSYGWSERNSTTYGIHGQTGLDLVETALNLKSAIIYDQIWEGGKKKSVKNQVKTLEAQEKQSQIEREFKKWVLQQPESAKQLEDIYNDKFNGVVIPQWRGATWRNYPGASEDVELREHQKDVVARILENSTLLAHAVGTGKTYIMATAAMEMRRLGLARKPMIVVQNATIDQFAASFKKLYPTARLLVPGAKDRDAKSRNKTMSRIASGDWDAVIVPQSFINMLPDNAEREAAYIDERLYELREALKEAAHEEGERAPKTKDLQRAVDRLESQLDDIADRKKDNVMTFEELGVDALFVDEAHAYKKNEFSTQMENIKGLDKGRSQRAFSMYMKVRWIQENNQGRNVIFATGTPVSNTIAEAWNMMRFVRPDILKAYSIENFDQFAATFGDTITQLEMTPGGTWKMVTRFAKYTNGPELIAAWRSVADVINADEVKGIKLPAIKNGKPTAVAVKKTPLLENYVKFIRKELERFAAMSGAAKRENSHIPLVMYGLARKASLDMRMVSPGAPDEPGSKLNRVAERVGEIYRESSDGSGTQMIFSDLYQDNPDNPTFNLYEELQSKLIEQGIPVEEIVIMSDKIKDAKREVVFQRMKEGKVRVLIGSTERMGVGVNVQDKMVAIHHMDPTNRPMDNEQRNGRGVRQGNENEEIEILNYGVEGTLDAAMYQRNAVKQKFTNQVMKGNITGRDFEDAANEQSMSFEEQMAAFSGDPRAIERIGLETEVRNLEALRRGHYEQVRQARDRLLRNQNDIPKEEAAVKEAQERAARFNAAFKDKEVVVEINEKKLEGKERNEALTAILAKKMESGLKAAQDSGIFSTETTLVPAGMMTVNGMRVGMNVAVERDKKGVPIPEKVKVRWRFTDGDIGGSSTTGAGFVHSLDSALENIQYEVVQKQTNLQRTKKDVKELTGFVTQEFDREGELEQSKKRLEELIAVLDKEGKEAEAKARKEAAEEDAKEEDDDPDEPGGGGDQAMRAKGSEGKMFDPAQTKPTAPQSTPTSRVKFNITALVQLLGELGSSVSVNSRLRSALGKYKISQDRIELMGKLMYDEVLAERVLSHEVGHLIDLAIEQEGTSKSFARKIKPLEAFKKKIKDSAELKKLAKALSAEWRGEFSPDDKYRNSANELFADYMSAMFNDPELVNTKYALLHDTFQALLYGKPDFAAAYKVLTDRILGKGIAKEWVDRTMEVTDTSIEELTSHERKSWGEFWRNLKDGTAGMFKSPVHRLDETQGKEISKDLGRTMMDTLEYASLFAAKENAFFEDDFRKNVAPHLAQISDDVTEAFKLLDVYVQANRTINERRAAGKWIEQNHEDEARKLLLGLVDQDTGLEKWVPIIKEAKDAELYDIAARIFREVHQGGEAYVARMERRINRMELEVSGEAAMLAFNVRGKLLNPKGITPETAKEAIVELRSRVTPEKFTAIEAAQRELANLLFTIQYKAFNEGLISARAFNEIVLPNRDNYAPYVVLDYFTGQVTAGMAQQKGGARDVMNTVLATQLKAGAINGWRKSQYFTAMLMLAYENSGKGTKLGEALERASDIEEVRKKHPDDDISRLVWYKDGIPHVMEFPNDPGKTYEQASTAPTRWESLEALGPISNVASGALQVFTGWSLPFMLWGNLVRDLSSTADRIGWLATIQSMAKGGHKDFEKLRLARNFARAAYGGILDPKVRELIAKDILQPPRTSTAIVFDNENRRELLAAGTIMAYNLTRHQLGSKAAQKAKAWTGLNKLTRASMMYEALAKLHALDVARAAGHDEQTAAALARRAGISKPTVSGANRYVNAAMELLHPWTRVMIQGNRASYNVLMNPSTGKGFAARFVAAQLGWKITAVSIKWGVPFMLYAWFKGGGDDDEEEKEAKTKGALAVFGQAMMRISPYKMGMGTVMPILFYDPRTGEYHDFDEFWDDATKIPAHYETVSIRIPASEEGKMFGPLFYNAMVSGDEELRMPGMDIGGAIRSWVKNQALPGDNPFIEVGGNTFSMLFGENPDNDFTGYPAANPLLYDAGWGAGRGEAIIGYILANTGFPSAVAGKVASNVGVLDERALNTFSRRLSSDQKTIVDEIPGMGSLITYDNYQPTRERGEKRVEHAEVEARAKMILPKEYKEMLDFYHRNKGKQDTMDAYELTRFIAAQGFVNTWGDVTNPKSDYGGGGDTLNVERARVLASGEVRIDAPTLHAKAVWAEANGASQQLKDSIAADVEELGGMWLGLFQQPQQFIDNMRSPEAK